ncbi:MAG: GNAT family N-acetyltransferase [Myxococcota bacterium]|nr:GNAT family N-acetyltransferase [Myxococcota bacterium]
MYALRYARPDDLTTIQTIEQRAATRFIALGMPAAAELPVQPLDDLRVAGEARRLLVAVDRTDAPVGFALFEAVDDAVHLQELDVLPEHGGRGLGRQLVEAVAAWGVAEKLGTMTLTTFRDVPFNAPFYARAGFGILDEHELTPRLARIREEERSHGVDLAPRVAMCRRL